VQFWKPSHVAEALLRSVNAKNIFFRFLEGFDPGGLGKQVACLLVAFCEIAALSDAD
jgi:hypothetical protein